MAVSPDGKRVATGSPDRAIRIRDVATGQVLGVVGETRTEADFTQFQ